MAITARKITAFAKTIVAMGVRPALKHPDSAEWFDSSPEELRVALNGAIDDLGVSTDGSSGADSIGAGPVTTGDVSTATVMGKLKYLYAQIQAVFAEVQAAVAGQIPDGTLSSNKFAVSNTAAVFYSGATTNVGNAYSVASPAITTYEAGTAVSIKVNADSTAAATLNINGVGAKAIKKATGSAVTNLKAGSIYTLRYNGTNFILQGEGGSGDATASDLLSGKTASTDAGDITGTMPNRAGDQVPAASATNGLHINVFPKDGYYDGVNDKIILSNSNFCKSGYSTVDFSGATPQTLTITGLGFVPRFVLVQFNLNSNAIGFNNNSVFSGFATGLIASSPPASYHGIVADITLGLDGFTTLVSPHGATGVEAHRINWLAIR